MIPAYIKKYPKLFAPLTIRRGRNEFVFNNRVMMAPVGICATGGGADNGRINTFGRASSAAGSPPSPCPWKCRTTAATKGFST